MFITSGPEDAEEIEMPHHDALIVTAMISGIEVRRVFIDGGRSANILFASALEAMGIPPGHVSSANSALQGLRGTDMKTLGQIKLPATFRDGEMVRTGEVTFDVVDMSYPYNVILGRAPLNRFGAVPHDAYLCVKIPTEGGVITIKGNQALSRELDGGTVVGRKEIDAARKREEPREEDQRRHQATDEWPGEPAEPTM